MKSVHSLGAHTPCVCVSFVCLCAGHDVSVVHHDEQHKAAKVSENQLRKVQKDIDKVGWAPE